jgi:hypothetical protein
MAALRYKNHFIIATGHFDKDLDRWIPIADVSWHLGSSSGRNVGPATIASRVSLSSGKAVN